jgi:cytochrome c-type biogenesis protein CcmF
VFLVALISALNSKLSFMKLVTILAISTLATIYAHYYSNLSLVSALAFISATIVICNTLYHLWQELYYMGHISLNNLSMLLSHTGFSVLVLAIILNNNFKQELEFIGKIGDTTTTKELAVTLENIKFAESHNYFKQIAIFKLEDRSSNKVVTLKPENRLYKIEKTLSQEAYIMPFIFCDFYAVLSKIDGHTIHAIIYKQHFISFIWLAIGIIVLGFTISLYIRVIKEPNKK